MGTYAGLQRFDGYEFRDYTYDPNDSTSISDNFISTIFEDNSGNLWIGTMANGLSMFDKQLETFYHFRHDPDNSNTLSSNMIPRAQCLIVQDRDSHLWVNTDNGLNRIRLTDRSVESYYGDFAGQVIYDDKAFALWIAGTRLKKFDLRSKRLSYHDPDPVRLKDLGVVNSFIMDTEGNIWLGTDAGVILYDKSEQEFLNLQEYMATKDIGSDRNYSWCNEPVNSVYEDFRGHIWFGIGNRLINLNKTDGTYEILVHEPDNVNSPTGSSISGIYGNKSGVLWISYLNQGVSKLNINLKNFSLYRHRPGDPNSLSGNTIRSIYIDGNQYFWIGTYDNGLNRIDPNTGIIRHYMADPGNPNSIVSNYIAALYVDKKERLWVGSFDNGICYADEIYSSKQLDFKSSELLSNLEIHEFTEDPAGRIWISTQNGFFIYDWSSKEFIHYGDLENQLQLVQDINIQSVVFQAPNMFWLATWNSGLCRLFINSDTILSPNFGRDSIVIHNRSRDQFNSSIDNKFITIHRSNDGELWLGSYLNGLIKISETPEGLEFLKYDKTAGAPDNSVYGIASDRQGNIWISTNNGLGRFTPETEQFRNYYMSDGLQSNSFMWDASFESSEGQLFFGGVNGMNAFYPEYIVDNLDLPNVYISKLIINNEDVRIGDDFRGNVILNKDIRYTKNITLSYRESVFSLEFTAMDNINPLAVLYRYKLEGFDEDWIQTTAEKRFVRYTNLNAGTYKFNVKASNSDGIWKEEPATLEITVLPPWWKTWLAIVIYSCTFAMLLIAFRKFILGRAQLIHEAKMEHLEREKTEEMYQMKLRFFTSISHEFRTPLTLVLGPLQRIIEGLNDDRRFTKQIITIRRNADRLFRLIDQVIEFRKIETNKIKLYAAKGDIVSFVRELVDSFEEIACQRSITLDFHSDIENCEIWFDENKLDKIVYNLLSNALKFTADKGCINVNFSSSPASEIQMEYVELKIEDNGIGISEYDLEHIFDRYYRVENPDSFAQIGSGIGLSLAKELTELHKGKINVSSKLGKGTCFTVLIPLGKDHLSEDEIVERMESKTGQIFSVKQFALTDEQEYIDKYDPAQPRLDQGELPLLLIVDDDQELRTFIKNNFSSNHIVIEAENGVEGFDMALKNNPDIIISDIMMPVMDGIELCRKLKSDIKTSHIPIILLTAKASIDSKIEGLDTGADAYIAKPFTIKLIEVQIHNILENRKSLRKKFSKELILQPSEIFSPENPIGYPSPFHLS